MNKTLNILAILLISISTFSQKIDTSFVGRYTDGTGDFTITEICLRENVTFYMKTPDPIFTLTHQKFESEGVWISRNDTVFLNPGLKQLKTEVNIKEKNIDIIDSILIKVKYFIEYFQSDSILMKEEESFQSVTICINKKRKYFNMIRNPYRRMCALPHKARNRIIIDSTNTIKITKNDLDSIGVFTCGFDNVIWKNIANKNANYLELEIIQQIDINRAPRNRELIIKGDRLYYYKRKGKIDKLLEPLIRK